MSITNLQRQCKAQLVNNRREKGVSPLYDWLINAGSGGAATSCFAEWSLSNAVNRLRCWVCLEWASTPGQQTYLSRMLDLHQHYRRDGCWLPLSVITRLLTWPGIDKLWSDQGLLLSQCLACLLLCAIGTGWCHAGRCTGRTCYIHVHCGARQRLQLCTWCKADLGYSYALGARQS